MTRQVPVSPAPGVSVEDDSVDLREYLYVFDKYKWFIAGVTVTLGLVAAIIALLMDPVYRSTATVLIEQKTPNIVSVEDIYKQPDAVAEYFETQAQILRSRELAGQVIRRLGIDKHPEFDPTIEQAGINLNPMKWIRALVASEDEQRGENWIRNQLYERFLSRLRVTPLPNSQLLSISFEAEDPELTAKVPNTLAEVYVENVKAGRLEVTRQATDWMTERLEELREAVRESEQKLQAYREEENLVDVEGVYSVAAQQLDQLTAELVDARRQLSDAEALYSQVSALKGRPPEDYASIPAVLEDPSVQRAREVFNEAERTRSELADRYGPKHPRMVAANAKYEAARRSLQNQVQSVVDSVARKYQVARSRERELSQAMLEARSDAKGINRKQERLRTLQSEVDSNRHLYETFLNRIKETTATSDLQPANARVVDPAITPTEPVKPQRKLIVLIAMFLGGSGSLVLSFLIEGLDNTLKDSLDAEAKLHLPVLGILPRLDIWINKDRRALRYYTDHQQTGFSENIRSIRTALLMTRVDEKKKVVLITSGGPGEGKSAVSINLALALGQVGKTLLVDADMRRPSVAKVFGLGRKRPGLSELIAGTVRPEECLCHMKDWHLYILPAGGLPPDPLELLSSQRFAQLVRQLKSQFDYVVIDSAPVIAVSDPLIISKHVDAAIYVIKADDSPYQMALDGTRRLRRVEAPLIGVVMNQVVEPARKPGRYGYYQPDYFTYYGYNKTT
jgi:capsular exopolysaccharide synthesis family protein